MLLGLITALIIVGINKPLIKFLVDRVKTPGKFLLAYLLLGLVSVLLGFLLLSLFFVFDARTYWLVGLLVYASMGGDAYKRLKGAVSR